jgi:hypothetical protein
MCRATTSVLVALCLAASACSGESSAGNVPAPGDLPADARSSACGDDDIIAGSDCVTVGVPPPRVPPDRCRTHGRGLEAGGGGSPSVCPACSSGAGRQNPSLRLGCGGDGGCAKRRNAHVRWSFRRTRVSRIVRLHGRKRAVGACLGSKKECGAQAVPAARAVHPGVQQRRLGHMLNAGVASSTT